MTLCHQAVQLVLVKRRRCPVAGKVNAIFITNVARRLTGFGSVVDPMHQQVTSVQPQTPDISNNNESSVLKSQSTSNNHTQPTIYLASKTLAGTLKFFSKLASAFSTSDSTSCACCTTEQTMLSLKTQDSVNMHTLNQAFY